MVGDRGPFGAADRLPQNSLKVAAEFGAKTVAFPAIYRWPIESAPKIARAAVADAPVELVRFVLFDRTAY